MDGITMRDKIAIIPFRSMINSGDGKMAKVLSELFHERGN